MGSLGAVASPSKQMKRQLSRQRSRLSSMSSRMSADEEEEIEEEVSGLWGTGSEDTGGGEEWEGMGGNGVLR